MLERRQDGVRDEEDDSMQGFNWFFETLFQPISFSHYGGYFGWINPLLK